MNVLNRHDRLTCSVTCSPAARSSCPREVTSVAAACVLTARVPEYDADDFLDCLQPGLPVWWKPAHAAGWWRMCVEKVDGVDAWMPKAPPHLRKIHMSIAAGARTDRFITTGDHAATELRPAMAYNADDVCTLEPVVAIALDARREWRATNRAAQADT